MEDKEFLVNLIEHPRENLAVEIKKWLDPDSPKGIAEIAKTCIAMRNNNGGFLILGFSNSGKPVLEDVPQNMREKFHIDKIQGLITKYASEPFEIEVHFEEKDGLEHPIISIPSGVRTPVATKNQLQIHENPRLIPKNRVYVRSLNSNNTASTTEATWKDWDRLTSICFDNREADIGRFIRRHLIGISGEKLVPIVDLLKETMKSTKPAEEIAEEYLDESQARFQELIKLREVELPFHGTWEVSLLISGEIPESPSKQKFLNLILSSNPNYTGWPVWVDSHQFVDKSSKPHFFEGTWEALIISLKRSWSDHIDYWRIHPSDRFYLRRALEDDLSNNAPEPNTALDFGITILRVAETIAVGIAFAKALGCNEETCGLVFAFRWSQLGGRILCSWAEPSDYLRRGHHQANQDKVTVKVNVPLEIPTSSIYQKVQEVIEQLFETFDGFEMDIRITEQLTEKLLTRRL